MFQLVISSSVINVPCGGALCAVVVVVFVTVFVAFIVT